MEKEQNFKIKTDLLTLERVGDVLLELGLGSLIGLVDKEKRKEEALSELLIQLTAKRKLRTLINIITGDGIGTKETMEASTIVAIFEGFFTAIGKNIANAVQSLPIAKIPKK